MLSLITERENLRVSLGNGIYDQENITKMVAIGYIEAISNRQLAIGNGQ